MRDKALMPAISEKEALELLLAAVHDGRLAGAAMPEGGWPAASGIAEHRPGDTYDVVLCLLALDDRPLRSADNRTALCHDCGRRVQYRPESPAGPYSCLPCAAARLGPSQ
ncbi:MAG TPA: hypothetical protein VGF07_13260 [Stellaceae bacterium]